MKQVWGPNPSPTITKGQGSNWRLHLILGLVLTFQILEFTI
jgi:hypothetical protein